MRLTVLLESVIDVRQNGDELFKEQEELGILKQSAARREQGGDQFQQEGFAERG